MYLALTLSFASPSWAESPRDNFAAWYSGWLESFPAWKKVTRERFFGSKDGKPFIMIDADWVSGEHRISTLDNFKVNNTYKRLINSRYAAKIVTTLGSSDPVWSISDFALPTDNHYDSLVSSFGVQEGLLYQHELLFARPYTSSEDPTIDKSTGKSRLILQFDTDSLTTDRQAQKIAITFDDTFGGMPIEIAIEEKGGIRSRHEIGGWHLSEGNWVHETVSIFIQLAGQKTEQLHSTKFWEYGISAGIPPTAEECFLTHYGLPEPPEQRIGGWLRIVFFLMAIMLLIIGYATLRPGNKLARRDL